MRIIVQEYLAGGISEEEIMADFPDLTREDIRACLAFAADRELMTFPPLFEHWSYPGGRAKAVSEQRRRKG